MRWRRRRRREGDEEVGSGERAPKLREACPSPGGDGFLTGGNPDSSCPQFSGVIVPEMAGERPPQGLLLRRQRSGCCCPPARTQTRDIFYEILCCGVLRNLLVGPGRIGQCRD